MKNNKNTKTKNHFAIKSIFALAVILAIFSASCSMVGGFSRSTAANLIENNNNYKAPATMTIDIGGRLSNAGAKAPQLSADEPVESAISRAKEDFAKRQPQIIVAEQLGFIKLFFEKAELRSPNIGEPNYRTDLKIWTFRARAEITDKGKELWKGLNLNVDEENLPLAVRGAAEITGLKDENQTMKSAEFTYKWQATELGKAFSVNSSIYKNLPPELQNALQQTQFDLFGQGNNNIMDFDKPRTGRAFFQKFDDGWRLGQLYFM